MFQRPRSGQLEAGSLDLDGRKLRAYSPLLNKTDLVTYLPHQFNGNYDNYFGLTMAIFNEEESNATGVGNNILILKL